jgi:hypothetical protein
MQARMYDSIAFRECTHHSEDGDEVGQCEGDSSVGGTGLSGGYGGGGYGRGGGGCGKDGEDGGEVCNEDTNTLSNLDAESRAFRLILRVDAPLLRVASCFGGLMLYKWRAIQGLRYSDDITGTTTDCEHVVLHRRMAKRGHRRIFLAPSMLYIHGS